MSIDYECYECPYCGWLLTFKFDEDKYKATRPFCNNPLEIEKEEFEKDKEIYFKADS